MRTVPTLLIGIVSGAALAAAVGQRWGGSLGDFIISAGGSTLIAGFGGAALGGVVTYMLTIQANAQALARDEAERVATEHAQALRTIFVATELSNHAYTIDMTIARALAGIAPGEQPFTRLVPYIKPSRPLPIFSTSDFVPFIKMKRVDLIQRCVELDGQVTALDAGFDKYTSLREEWDRLAAAHTVFKSDGTASTEFTDPNEAKEAEFKVRLMNQLIADLQRHAPQASELGNTLCDDLNDAFQKYFGDNAGLRLLTLTETSDKPKPAGSAPQPPPRSSRTAGAVRTVSTSAPGGTGRR